MWIIRVVWLCGPANSHFYDLRVGFYDLVLPVFAETRTLISAKNAGPYDTNRLIQNILTNMKEIPVSDKPSRMAYERPSVEVTELVPEFILAASGEATVMPRGWDWNI